MQEVTAVRDQAFSPAGYRQGVAGMSKRVKEISPRSHGSNIGIGVDIEDPARFKDRDQRKPLYARVFSRAELRYCFSKKYPWIHLAGRFAGKEAVIKAASGIAVKGPVTLRHRQIEITNDASGQPIVTVHNHGLRGLEVRVSISHIDIAVVACALIIREGRV